MDISYHGGACCGMRHIHSMDNASIADLDRLISNLDNEDGQGNRLIEIVLSSRQVDEPGARNGNRWHESVREAGGWPAVLQEHGFRLVSRFNNSNSHNDCYVFHRVPRFRSIRAADLPFTWRHEAAPARPLDEGGPGRAARPAAPAPRVTTVATISTFHNVLRDGRSDAGYPTCAAARAKAPRARRVDRKDIVVSSNGTTRTNWIEGVNG